MSVHHACLLYEALSLFPLTQVEARQKLLEAKEKEKDEEKKTQIDEDAPGNDQLMSDYYTL